MACSPRISPGKAGLAYLPDLARIPTPTRICPIPSARLFAPSPALRRHNVKSPRGSMGATCLRVSSPAGRELILAEDPFLFISCLHSSELGPAQWCSVNIYCMLITPSCMLPGCQVQFAGDRLTKNLIRQLYDFKGGNELVSSLGVLTTADSRASYIASPIFFLVAEYC